MEKVLSETGWKACWSLRNAPLEGEGRAGALFWSVELALVARCLTSHHCHDHPNAAYHGRHLKKDRGTVVRPSAGCSCSTRLERQRAPRSCASLRSREPLGPSLTRVASSCAIHLPSQRYCEQMRELYGRVGLAREMQRRRVGRPSGDKWAIIDVAACGHSWNDAGGPRISAVCARLFSPPDVSTGMLSGGDEGLLPLTGNPDVRCHPPSGMKTERC